jgi:hypothetical protein
MGEELNAKTLSAVFNVDYINLNIPKDKVVKARMKTIEFRVIKRLRNDLHIGLPGRWVVTTIATNYINIMLGDFINRTTAREPLNFNDYFTVYDADKSESNALPVKIITGTRTIEFIKTIADCIERKEDYITPGVLGYKDYDKDIRHRITDKTSSYLLNNCLINVEDASSIIPIITTIYFEESLKYLVEEAYRINNQYNILNVIFDDNFSIILVVNKEPKSECQLKVNYELRYEPVM